MGFRPLIIILFFLVLLGLDARAQVPQEEISSSMPEQWQLTLDVIKSKAQSLVVENNDLQSQYRQLGDQVQQLQQSIAEQQSKNEQINNFLQQRHGRTDQEARIEELVAIVKTKKQQAAGFDGQLKDLQKKQAGLDNNIQQLKYTISGLELRQQAQAQKASIPQPAGHPQADNQLAQLRQDLEDESKKEVVLENELEAYKSGKKGENLNVDTINDENRQLEVRLDMLRLQKLQHLKETSQTQLSQASARMYDRLKIRKDQLEASIYAYEMRMDQLRQSSLMALSWPLKKKNLVHSMVQLDARNNQLRDNIKVLREDIDVLRDQVARLERRLDFAQGKDTKQ